MGRLEKKGVGSQTEYESTADEGFKTEQYNSVFIKKKALHKTWKEIIPLY